MDLRVKKETKGQRVHQAMMVLMEIKERKVNSVVNAHYHRGDPREILVVLVNLGIQEQLDPLVILDLRGLRERLVLLDPVDDLEIL